MTTAAVGPDAAPGDDTLYAALLARDPACEGLVWVAVVSTGIYCRLTCPARKPLRSNCRFVRSPAEGVAAGFRACRRCNPDAAATPPPARRKASA